MNEMKEPRTELFEKLKGRLFSYLVKGSVSEPPEALEGIPGQGLTVAFERFLHEVALCLSQEGALRSTAAVTVEKEAEVENAAVSCSRAVGTSSAGTFVGD
jgi:hypothetical protein